MKKSKQIMLFSFALVTVLLIGKCFNFYSPSILVAQTLVNSPIVPTGIEICLKDIKQNPKKTISHYRNDNKDFYLLRYLGEASWPIFPDQFEEAHFYRIIVKDNLGCLVTLDGIPSRLNSWKKFVPHEVANIFALDDLKVLIREAGGTEKFLKKNFVEVIRDGTPQPWQFFPETIWAFKQLGIKIPQPYQVVEIYNFSSDE